MAKFPDLQHTLRFQRHHGTVGEKQDDLSPYPGLGGIPLGQGGTKLRLVLGQYVPLPVQEAGRPFLQGDDDHASALTLVSLLSEKANGDKGKSDKKG